MSATFRCPVCGEEPRLRAAKAKREYMEDHMAEHDEEIEPSDFWVGASERT